MKINEYNIQYWLYAVLNAKFGAQLTFRRSSLHSRYEANRHDFEVIPTLSKNKAAFTYLYEYLCHELILAGYSTDTSSYNVYVKSFGTKTVRINLECGAGVDGRLHFNITSYVHNNKI